MATYVFVASDGAVLEREYPIGKAPKIGRSIKSKGKRYMRVPSIGLQAQMVNNIAYMTSVQLPLKWPFAPGHDARGQPRFQNFREVRESIARAKHAGEPVDWD